MMEHMYRLIDALFACPALFAPAPSPKGYRNKMTYGIQDPFVMSELAIPAVNEVCQAVFDWAQKHSGRPLAFWREVAVKLTRSSAILLKIVLCTTPEGFEEWRATQSQPFVEYMRERFNVVTVVAQTTPGAARPSKTDEYHVLAGDGWVLEHTANNVPFRVSADTFSEVNHYMESRMWDVLKEWCGRDQTGGTNLLCLGRDMSGMALAFSELGWWNAVYGMTHCPRVYGDALSSLSALHPESIIQFQHHPKDALGDAVRALPNDHPMTVVLTAGRHGLHPDIVAALASKACIRKLVYISCNINSLKPDAVRLLGYHPGCPLYTISNFHSFDFFPDTRYRMSFTELERRGDLLLLPVGPAGVGKTTFSQLVSRTFPEGSTHHVERDRIFMQHRGAEGSTLMRAKQDTHEALVASLTPIVRPPVVVLDSTNGGHGARSFYRNSFAADPLDTPHAPPLRCLIVDLWPSISDVDDETTTTTDPAAAPPVILHTTTGTGAEEPAGHPVTKRPRTEEEGEGMATKELEGVLAFCLERTRGRLTEGDGVVAGNNGDEPHPCFPGDVEGQRDKIRRILQGIERPVTDGEEAPPGMKVDVLHWDPRGDIQDLMYRVFLWVFADGARRYV